MANDNDINDANQGAPAFEIPDLKKKEKERKKSGVAVGGGANPGAAGFQGAKAAASAAGSAGSAASGSSSILAGFASTLAGKAVLGLAAAVVFGGGGLAVLSMMRGGGGAPSAGGADLSGIESSIKVRTRRADRTTYLDHRGEVAFEAAKPAAKADPKPGAPGTPGAAMPGDTMENGTIGGVQDGENKDKLEHNLSGAKLSSSMGGSFGSKNVFAGNSNAPKFSDMSKSALKASSLGRSTAMKQSRGGASSSRRAGRRISANKAIGELRLVGGLSQRAANSSTSEASQANATNAFEGQNTEGGATPQAEMPDTPPSVMGGGGGGGGGGGSADSLAQNTQMLDMLAMMMRLAGSLMEQGEKMKQYGLYMMIVGGILLCTGEPISQAIGAVLLALGIMMDDMGKGMIKMAEDMIAGVKNSAAAQAAATGDTHQQNVTNYCADQAIANGTDPNDCDPPEDIDHQAENERREREMVERLERERREITGSYGGGG